VGCRLKLTKLLLIFISLFSSPLLGAEESLDLENESSKTLSPQSEVKNVSPKFTILGRVDLTMESTPAKETSDSGKSSLENKHFLLFLKTKASERTRFMGEFVRQSFFQVEYLATKDLTVSFGKIIVPFGDTRYFHHFYGGLQGYGASGTMFPNIWAESGANLSWIYGASTVDTYFVNSIGSLKNDNSEPDFQVSTTGKQALGFRLTTPSSNKFTTVFSGYETRYAGTKLIHLLGGDIYTDYGALGFSFLRHLRLSAGVANAWISSDTKGYEKRGDYFQLASNFLTPAELRLRYGTYIDDSRSQTVKDVHNFNLGLTYPVDVIKILAEYQWNYEAVNEVDNDLARVMVSLDF